MCENLNTDSAGKLVIVQLLEKVQIRLILNV